MKKKLIIVGSGDYAEIACRYFQSEGRYEVAAFAVNREYLKTEQLLGLPIVAFEDCESHFPPGEHDILVALLESHLNRDRARLFTQSKEKGYTLASYISPRAFVDAETTVGENVFIFEDNVLQRGCRIGDNTILWSGNHIGHQSRIGAHVFITSHVVISGFCEVGDYSYFGVNAAVGDGVRIGADCTIGAGAVVTANIADNSAVQPPTPVIRENISRRFWRVKTPPD